MAKMEPLTTEQLYALPPTVPFNVACSVLDISPTTGRELLKDDEFPFNVQRVGKNYKVARIDLLKFCRLPLSRAAAIEAGILADAA